MFGRRSASDRFRTAAPAQPDALGQVAIGVVGALVVGAQLLFAGLKRTRRGFARGEREVFSGQAIIDQLRRAPGFVTVLRGPDYIIEFASDAVRRALGGREIEGRPYAEAVPEFTPPQFLEMMNKVMAGETVSGRGVAARICAGPGTTPELRYFDFVHQPIELQPGDTAGVFIQAIDVTERVTSEKKIDAERRRLSLILDQLPVGVLVLDGKSGSVVYNRRAEVLLGHGPTASGAEYHAAYGGKADHAGYGALHPDGRRYRPEEYPLNRALRGEEVLDVQMRYGRPDGVPISLSANASPLKMDDAHIVVATIQDISKLQDSLDRQTLLIDELNHRVKNTLATIQGIAAQTFGRADLGLESAATFEGRLIALSKAHDLLTRSSWRGSSLFQLLETATAPFGSSERFAIVGPSCIIPPKQAVALSLALHELGSNAVKHGALSWAEGRVAITWAVEGVGLKLRWQESGGPAVTAVAGRGFGRRLLERALPRELHGEVRLEFEPEGVCCTIEARLGDADACEPLDLGATRQAAPTLRPADLSFS